MFLTLLRCVLRNNSLPLRCLKQTNNMEIKGRIIHVLPLQEGVSKAGNPWKKQEYVLETLDQYPKKVCFDLFGEKADQYRAEIGDEVVLSFDIESREYNGRWFTSIRGWKLDKAVAEAAPVMEDVPPMPNVNFSAPFPMGDVNTDDLPF